jgi:hypothetical protein
MLPETLFRIHLVLGYLAWLLCFGVYIWPRLRSMDHVEAQRAIATLHSFRFFGPVFILPGVVGNLPSGFATFAAYGDLATLGSSAHSSSGRPQSLPTKALGENLGVFRLGEAEHHENAVIAAHEVSQRRRR